MEKKTNLRKMEEIDARIDKINYDLIGLENRKNNIIRKNRQYEIFTKIYLYSCIIKNRP